MQQIVANTNSTIYPAIRSRTLLIILKKIRHKTKWNSNYWSKLALWFCFVFWITLESIVFTCRGTLRGACRGRQGHSKMTYKRQNTQTKGQKMSYDIQIQVLKIGINIILKLGFLQLPQHAQTETQQWNQQQHLELHLFQTLLRKVNETFFSPSSFKSESESGSAGVYRGCEAMQRRKVRPPTRDPLETRWRRGIQMTQMTQMTQSHCCESGSFCCCLQGPSEF